MNNSKYVSLPKISLHDHLDGGVRPETLFELGAQHGLHFPANSSAQLAYAIARKANSKSLESYLEAFSWTIPVMQSEQALTRIAREAVEDLAADGVILAELRFAPTLHTREGLSPQQAINAVIKGLQEGTLATGVPAGLILCGLRCNDEFDEIVALFRANTFKNSLVVGVDLAGPEKGFPVMGHPAIAKFAAEQPGAPITLHAGEADGVRSIWQAIEAGAKRIGHGTRLIDDILGDRKLLQVIRDQQILLEVCLSSNEQTGCVVDIEHHPVARFLQEGVLLNLEVDNRLVSATKHSREYALAHQRLGISFEAMINMARNALNASFLPTSVKAQVRTRYLEGKF